MIRLRFMRYWFRGKRGGLILFLVIAGLVLGGLGWVTAAALRLEREQLEARAQAELLRNLHLALWRLDGRVAPILAQEDSRPYSHYTAVHAPSVAVQSDGTPCQPGSVLEPSPLLSAELPPWMLLHFQADQEAGWSSPQVLSPTLVDRLNASKLKIALRNVTSNRKQLLAELSAQLPPATVLASLRRRGGEPTAKDTALVLASTADGRNMPLKDKDAQQMVDQEYLSRSSQQTKRQTEGKNAVLSEDAPVPLANTVRNGEDWFRSNLRRGARSQEAPVALGALVPLWLADGKEQDRLMAARLVRIGQKQICQGIVLDWPRLQALLAEEIHDLFPEARLRPVKEEEPPFPERTMAALPVQLDPGLAASIVSPGWTPLRVGLVLAWAAALVALLAVGLGGWSLIDLSERRFRFVSAVTHELRTPLTTLRLYLDMLTGGLITEEKQKSEYLHTLHTETDRLSRLVGNVLDFSRLENQRPRLTKTEVKLADLLEQVRLTWQGRCQDAQKDLVLDNTAGDVTLLTDSQLVQQTLGNLIDNACKYSRGAEDRRIWLRARSAAGGVALEVEDGGPGIPSGERRSIFRPFRRGRGADVVAGGVGLGLALAQRWACLLSGKLTLCNGPSTCFRLELPATKNTRKHV